LRPARKTQGLIQEAKRAEAQKQYVVAVDFYLEARRRFLVAGDPIEAQNCSRAAAAALDRDADLLEQSLQQYRRAGGA
jgi:hypothetical protein